MVRVFVGYFVNVFITTVKFFLENRNFKGKKGLRARSDVMLIAKQKRRQTRRKSSRRGILFFITQLSIVRIDFFYYLDFLLRESDDN